MRLIVEIIEAYIPELFVVFVVLKHSSALGNHRPPFDIQHSDEPSIGTDQLVMVINTGPNDGHPRSFRAAQNLRLARHWIVLLQHPLHPTALPSLSCPFLLLICCGKDG